MLNKKLLMAISNIKELYQELKFTSIGDDSSKNVFKSISDTTITTQLNNKLNLSVNNIINDQNIFSINIINDSNYNISGNLEKFPSVNFYNCSWLESVELPEVLWNYNSNKYETSMSYCFYDCINLTIPPNIPDNVTIMRGCFYSCIDLTTAPEYIGNSVTDMSSCFCRCYNLTTAPDIPNSVTNMVRCFNACYNLTGTMNIYSTEVTNVYRCFYNHYTNKPLSVYIQVPSNTYNTFLNDTSHGSSGWQLGVPKLGITLKDINDKPNSNISIFIDSTQGKKGSEIYFIPYSSTGEPQSERIDIEYDTWYKYPVNIGDYYVFDGKPSTQTRAPEAGELNFYPIDMINCNYEEYYFEHHVTITGQNAVFTAYTD